jgi:hypothetical protein
MQGTDPQTQQHSPRAYPTRTYADAVADCPTHRAQAEAADARYAEYGESIRRRDRIQLGLRAARVMAVTR